MKLKSCLWLIVVAILVTICVCCIAPGYGMTLPDPYSWGISVPGADDFWQESLSLFGEESTTGSSAENASNDFPDVYHSANPGSPAASYSNVNCKNVGKFIPNNPMRGWPLGTKYCEWNTITAYMCDPQYKDTMKDEKHPEGYTHKGIDFAFSGVDRVPVIVTMDNAVVVAAQTCKNWNPDNPNSKCWNSGMGNNVEVCAEGENKVCDFEDGAECYENEFGRTCAYNCKNKNFTKEDGYCAKYFHLYEVKVKVGDYLKYGQILGTVDHTGASTGPHLHYETSIKGIGAVDSVRSIMAECGIGGLNGSDANRFTETKDLLNYNISVEDYYKKPPSYYR
ncbi:MAG: M23 family metallopeptidase [Bacteroidales bacterium]